MMTADQLHTLRHMLGINTPDARVPVPHRNYAAVNPGDAEFAELERIGAVECYRRPAPGFAYNFFRCTDAGRAEAMASHRTIRRTKGSRVYSRWLYLHDAWPDVTFGEFLTSRDFADIRREA